MVTTRTGVPYVMTVIVEPDTSEPAGWVWEVYRPDPSRLHGRHILMESTSRWRWLAIARALWFAWLSRNNRYGGDPS